MHVIGQTHIGLVRENNQDALEYGTLGTTAQYAVVCDGMGVPTAEISPVKSRWR